MVLANPSKTIIWLKFLSFFPFLLFPGAGSGYSGPVRTIRVLVLVSKQDRRKGNVLLYRTLGTFLSGLGLRFRVRVSG